MAILSYISLDLFKHIIYYPQVSEMMMMMITLNNYLQFIKIIEKEHNAI